MWHWLAVGLLGLVGGEVEVTQLGGAKAAGTLQELSADGVVVKTAQGDQRLELKNVLGIAFVGRTATPTAEGKSATVVELIDGSTFTTNSLVSAKGVARVTVSGAATAEIRTRTIRSLRFSPTAALDQAWLEITAQKITGDTLIIRKPAKAENSDQPTWILDRQEGVVQEITADVIQFEIDGDRIPVKREKLEGLLFFQPVARELADPIGRVIDVSGGRWSAKTLKLSGDQLELETTTGALLALPLDRIEKLDFSSGNTLFLSDLEPDSVEWTPFVESRTAAARLSRLYQPRRDQAFAGGKLLLAGQSYDKGLSIHSRTLLTYRVPKNFKRLLATVGIDDRVRETGHVQLVVTGDNRTLFDRPISGKDAPIELDLDLTAVRRLTVLVDYGEGLDIADHLNLANARITK